MVHSEEDLRDEMERKQTYLFNVLWMVKAVPELAGEPQLRSRNTSLLDTGGDSILVSVSPSAVCE